MRIIQPICLTGVAALLALGFAAAGCDFADVDSVTAPGRLQVFVRYQMPSDYPVQPGDSLYAITRDFRLHRDTTYAEVYQHPQQFMFRADSLVSINMLDRDNENRLIQIAHASVAPLDYDRLAFEMSPTSWVKIGGRRYALRRAGEGAGTVFEVEAPLRIEEDRTTIVYLTVSVHRVLYRLGDEFVFRARADSVAVEVAQ